MQLVSPVTGAPLAPDADGHLVAPGERWPVVDGIPYLRTGREELIARVFALIDGGHGMQALLALLADSDDWWTAPPPSDADLQAAVHARTLRLAMDRLGYGPVGDYFAFRWSDPTFLSGLGLLDRHAGGAHSAFELACGIGHLLRELQLRGARVAGGDVVFSKLWLARRFVVPSAELVCFDAGAGLPVLDAYDVALCHDALHYVPDPALAVRELARLAPTVLVGHAHNAAVENLSPGAPLPVDGYAALLDGAVLYDDAELAASLFDGVDARPRPAGELAGRPAIALARGGASADGAYRLPRTGTRLRINPLLDGGRVRWPSERYEREYAALSPHLTEPVAIPKSALAVGVSDEVDALARRRVLVDLPQEW
jgi:SAM-dependent methyltransferase